MIIDLAGLPIQELGLAFSVAAFSVVSIALAIARQVNGAAPASLRLALWGLWLYALLRLSSASSYLWGTAARDAGALPALRLIVLFVVTLALIVSVALLAYYWRRRRSRR